MAGFVFTHGTIVASGAIAAGLFLLTLKARISWWAGAEVALFLVATCSAIVAGLRGAIVDVHFAKASREAGRTVAVGHVSLSQAQAAVAAESFFASQRLAFVAAFGSWTDRHG